MSGLSSLPFDPCVASDWSGADSYAMLAARGRGSYLCTGPGRDTYEMKRRVAIMTMHGRDANLDGLADG